MLAVVAQRRREIEHGLKLMDEAVKACEERQKHGVDFGDIGRDRAAFYGNKIQLENRLTLYTAQTFIQSDDVTILRSYLEWLRAALLKRVEKLSSCSDAEYDAFKHGEAVDLCEEVELALTLIRA